jgi:hypothetical protein
MNDLSLTFTCQNPVLSQPAQRLILGNAASAAEIDRASSPDHRANMAQPLSASDVWPFESVGEVALRILSKIESGWS